MHKIVVYDGRLILSWKPQQDAYLYTSYISEADFRKHKIFRIGQKLNNVNYNFRYNMCHVRPHGAIMHRGIYDNISWRFINYKESYCKETWFSFTFFDLSLYPQTMNLRWHGYKYEVFGRIGLFPSVFSVCIIALWLQNCKDSKIQAYYIKIFRNLPNDNPYI